MGGSRLPDPWRHSSQPCGALHRSIPKRAGVPALVHSSDTPRVSKHVARRWLTLVSRPPDDPRHVAIARSPSNSVPSSETAAYHSGQSCETGPDEQQHRGRWRSEEHTSELQSRPHLVCRLLLEKKKKQKDNVHE